MLAKYFIKTYVAVVALVCIVSLVYVYSNPPASMRHNRDGVPHFTPKVLHPETGDAIPMADLIKHFRGD